MPKKDRPSGTYFVSTPAIDVRAKKPCNTHPRQPKGYTPPAGAEFYEGFGWLTPEQLFDRRQRDPRNAP